VLLSITTGRESTSAPPSSRSCTSGSGGGVARSGHGGGLRCPSSDWTSPTRGHGASKMAVVGGTGGSCSAATRSSGRRWEVVGGPAAAGVWWPRLPLGSPPSTQDLEDTGTHRCFPVLLQGAAAAPSPLSAPSSDFLPSPVRMVLD
jgi:hypothetical protein